MFTGIITEIGKVKNVRRRGGFVTLEIACLKTLESSALGDSVSVNGVCLTVTSKSAFLSFDVVSNTLLNSNLKRLKTGDTVNLENALKMGEDVSGHLVSGHVDGERKVKKNIKSSSGWIFEVKKNPEDRTFVISKGSVSVDGVSLTVAENHLDFFRIFLIPYTLEDTTLAKKKAGSYVNVEYDVMGKYAAGKYQQGTLSIDNLRTKGFI